MKSKTVRYTDKGVRLSDIYWCFTGIITYISIVGYYAAGKSFIFLAFGAANLLLHVLIQFNTNFRNKIDAREGGKKRDGRIR